MTVTPEQLASTLLSRHRQLVQVRHDAAERTLDKLCRAVSRVRLDVALPHMWVIGSLEAGTFGPQSDVDLVCEGLSATKLPELWGVLERELGVSVDLMRIEDLPPSFAERVRREGRRLT